MCMAVHLSDLLFLKKSTNIKRHKQPFSGVILSRCSSILQINHIILSSGTPYFKAHILRQNPNLPNPFQINNKKKMGNFVLFFNIWLLLSQSYLRDSIWKIEIMFLSSLRRKNRRLNTKYILNGKEVIQVFILLSL